MKIMPLNHHSKTDKFRQNSDAVSDDDLMLDTERKKCLIREYLKYVLLDALKMKFILLQNIQSKA